MPVGHAPPLDGLKGRFGRCGATSGFARSGTFACRDGPPPEAGVFPGRRGPPSGLRRIPGTSLHTVKAGSQRQSVSSVHDSLIRSRFPAGSERAAELLPYFSRSRIMPCTGDPLSEHKGVTPWGTVLCCRTLFSALRRYPNEEAPHGHVSKISVKKLWPCIRTTSARSTSGSRFPRATTMT